HTRPRPAPLPATAREAITGSRRDQHRDRAAESPRQHHALDADREGASAFGQQAPQRPEQQRRRDADRRSEKLDYCSAVHGCAHTRCWRMPMPIAHKTNTIIRPWMTKPSEDGTPPTRAMARAPASRNPRNSPAGSTAIGLIDASKATATALKPKPSEKPSISR